MDERITAMIRLLDCPAAAWPDREIQVVELRQRHELARLCEWQDGISEVESSPRVPMLILRHAGNVGVATFNEGGPKPGLNVWGRFFPPIFPFGNCPTADLDEHAELGIAGTTHRARRAVFDITEHQPRPYIDALAVYGTHIPDLGRSVVVFGPPEQLDNIKLDWLQRT